VRLFFAPYLLRPGAATAPSTPLYITPSSESKVDLSTVVRPMAPLSVCVTVFRRPYICMRTATESISYSLGTKWKTAVTNRKVLVRPEQRRRSTIVNDQQASIAKRGVSLISIRRLPPGGRH